MMSISEIFGGDEDGDDLPWDTDDSQDSDTVSAEELEAAGQGSMFGAPEPAPEPAPAPKLAAPVSAQPYRVLARKYRSQTFAELIGQDAMVQTLANAIRRDRLAHAFLMTGIRGVGKTSTARLIAKALNCIGPDGKGGPTIDPCGQCEPCVAIAEGRHIDVIEMDAASHTGVDDVREIIEAVRYAAVSARYKIYIIDEVHMLSRNAFNALLKTLEEPPAHVKFLFATTEVDKLPITVLSRCQRFDLKRIPAELLAAHFARICEKEGVEAEAEALAMVAEAAEGSVRDGLSILDQAIAHADLASDSEQTKVTAEHLREMLGLADKTAQRQLFAALLAGDGAALLDLVAGQFALGVEPLALLRSAMEVTHRITVAQLGKRDTRSISQDEKAAIEGWAQQLSAGQLHRLWQLLLKGHDEVKTAPEPLVAAEMALLRCMHAADMPDPGQLVKKIEGLASGGVLSGAVAAASQSAQPVAQIAPAMPVSNMSVSTMPALEWRHLVEVVERESIATGSMMRLQVRVVDLAPGRLVFEQAPGFPEDVTPILRAALQKATDRVWEVERRSSGGAPSMVEMEEQAKAAELAQRQQSPLMQAAMAAFPQAQDITEEGQAGQPPRRQANWSR
ncbi:DNA polymerase III subunit gamma/tau [Novosphingobium umbonatum]|nr:DNA polymerase III subunit gamma/tau [Novosphingobium umbonatum]